MSNTSTPRVTLASTNARIDGLIEANTTLTGLVTRLVERLEQGEFSTPAKVAQITDAPSAKARAPKAARKAKGGNATTATSPLSYARAEALVAEGADGDRIMVLAGRFGKGEPVTFTQAKAKRAEADAKRTQYLAAREAGTLPKRDAKATAPKAAKGKSVKASEAKVDALVQASAYFGMSKVDLLADGSKGAQAELARRAAKRAAKGA